MSDDIEQLLNIDLENVHKLPTAHKLTLNMEKTEYMIIGSRQKLTHTSANPHIIIGDQTITRVKEKKVLGGMNDEQLRWKEHIHAQSKRISNNIALLRRAKEFVTHETLIKPHFIHCSNV